MTEPTLAVPRYVVMTSRAGPRGGRGNYRNVRVVETDRQEMPKMVSPRARHLVRIVRDLGAHYEGVTEACAYRRALAEAEAMAARLNGEGA